MHISLPGRFNHHGVLFLDDRLRHWQRTFVVVSHDLLGPALDRAIRLKTKIYALDNVRLPSLLQLNYLPQALRDK